MPFMDGTGPLGNGPGSGRGRGMCAGARRGAGRGSGLARGGGRGFGVGASSQADQKAALEQQAGVLESQLDEIKQRISRLKNE
jgi:hypothetical protein